MLEIKNLHAGVNGKEILKGINLSVKPGELHAIMGRNGSGKSTLANVITGRDNHEVTSGSVTYNGVDLLDMTPEDRALMGIFMSFQYPVVINGVNNTYFRIPSLNNWLLLFKSILRKLPTIGSRTKSRGKLILINVWLIISRADFSTKKHAI